ncbi:YhgE/Pip domain-containing protein [Virgibacillus halodenitrificans]|uniref:YhgE/Pip domain-containing protein n=1 Tax=Virgibacillus halodenitrificans TaxID=1482 RepID=UPI000A426707
MNSIFKDLQELSANTNNRIGDFLTEYEEEIEPTVRKQISSAKETLKNGRAILVDIKKTIPEVERILNSTEANLSDGKDMLEYMEGQYPYVNEKINELADKIRNIQGETDINEIIQLLQNDPEAEKGFFAEPVKLNKNELFPIPNYGSGMTPFYTVLAIWVGALLLISLLATDVHDINSYTARERYYGKLFTFFSIGILQTLIVTSGDILLLDAYVAEPGWFILFGIIISLVFMSIVYTVVTVFGDVGKAMAIIMLVLQIAGAGGTYPVVLLPSFFQKINPFLPFTYAIDLMREAVGGIVWDRAIHDLLFLLLFGLAFLILGTLFKERINRQTHKLMEKSKKAGLFH